MMCTHNSNQEALDPLIKSPPSVNPLPHSLPLPSPSPPPSDTCTHLCIQSSPQGRVLVSEPCPDPSPRPQLRVLTCVFRPSLQDEVLLHLPCAMQPRLPLTHPHTPGQCNHLDLHTSTHHMVWGCEGF